MSYMISHGSLDIEHMESFEQIVNRLDDENDRQAILHSLPVFYQLYTQIFCDLPVASLKHQEGQL